jgi:hypothetical protein
MSRKRKVIIDAFFLFLNTTYICYVLRARLEELTVTDTMVAGCVASQLKPKHVMAKVIPKVQM